MNRRYEERHENSPRQQKRQRADELVSKKRRNLSRVFGGSCTSHDKRVNRLLQRRNASYDEIVKIVIDEGALNLNTFNQVTALHRLARQNVRECSAAKALAVALEAKVAEERLSSRHLSNLSWCAAKIDRPALLVAVSSVCDLEDFNAQDMTNFLWACAKCGARPPRVTRDLLSRKTSSSTAQGIANAAWAVSTLGEYHLLDALKETIAAKIRDFNAQEIANVAWAFAKAGRDDFFATLAEKAVDTIQTFTAQNMTNVVWAFATKNYCHDELMRVVAIRLLRRSADEDAQTLSNAAWAYAKLKYFRQDLFSSLAECGMAIASTFSHDQRHVTRMIWAFSKYHGSCSNAMEKSETRILLNRLALVAVDSVSRLTSQNLCVILYSMAAVEDGDGDDFETSRSLFFDVASLRYASVAVSANAQDVSHVAWAFATLGRNDAAIFDQVEKQLPRLVVDFVPQNVANVAWALAKSGRGSDASFDLLKQNALSRYSSSSPLSEYQTQNLANLVYSFALARFERLSLRNDDDLFDAVGDELATRTTLCAQDTANAAWAFARVRRDHPLLRKIVVDSSFNSQNLANVAWALAVLDLGDKEPSLACLDPLVDEIESRLDSMKPQELATCAFALAKIFAPRKHDSRGRLQRLFNRLEVASLARFDAFNAQDVCTALWGFAALDILALDLFGAVRLDGDFDNARLSTVAWAFAKSEVEACQLFEDIKARIEWTKLETHEFSHLVWAFAAQSLDVKCIFDAYDAAVSVDAGSASHALLKRMKPCQYACVLWALATAGDVDRLQQSWSLLLIKEDGNREGVDGKQLDAFDAIARSQLQQARLVAGLEIPTSWDEPLRNALAKVDHPNKGSQSQRRLSLRLAQIIGWNHVYEHVDEFGLSLDMADPANKQAVEFDGPTHFFANAPTRPTARCALKRRLLRAVGWNTVHLSHLDDLSTGGLKKILGARGFRLEKPPDSNSELILVLPADEVEEESTSRRRESYFPGAPSLRSWSDSMELLQKEEE